MKKLFYLVLFIIFVAITLMFSASIFIKYKAQESLTHYIGLNTTIDTVKLNIWNGTFSIKGIQIENPKGFKNKHILQIEAVDTQIDMSTLFAQPLSIKYLNIKGTKILAE